MTVDRLAALEAALRRLGSMEAFATARAINEHDTELLARIDYARAALDAASPLTTPTPDQGALERARACLWPHLSAAVNTAIYDAVLGDVTAALTAAEAKGRAAAIDQACRLCALEAVRANDRAVHAKPFSRETTDVWCATARELEDRIAALLTPEQSET